LFVICERDLKNILASFSPFYPVSAVTCPLIFQYHRTKLLLHKYLMHKEIMFSLISWRYGFS